MLTVWQGLGGDSAVKLSVSPSIEQLERIMAIIRDPSLGQMVRQSQSGLRVTWHCLGHTQHGYRATDTGSQILSGKLHNNDKWPLDKLPYRHHIIQETWAGTATNVLYRKRPGKSLIQFYPEEQHIVLNSIM